MTSEGVSEEVLTHQPADLLELALQKLCQSLWDLEVYLASPAGRRLGTALAPLPNRPQAQRWPSEHRCWRGYQLRAWNIGPPAARLAPPTAPSVRLFCVAVAAGVEECPSSLVVEAMEEPGA